MSPEANPSRKIQRGKRSEEQIQPAPFTKRELKVLQTLADGLTKKQRVLTLGIPAEDIKTYERLISERQGKPKRQEGLRLAIVNGVRSGLIKTSSMLRYPIIPLETRERQVLASMVVGQSTSETCEFLGIAPRTLAEYRSSARRKLGLANQYQILAWATNDMVSRGELK